LPTENSAPAHGDPKANATQQAEREVAEYLSCFPYLKFLILKVSDGEVTVELRPMNKETFRFTKPIEDLRTSPFEDYYNQSHQIDCCFGRY
jgi:hypothetical protein